MENSHKKIVMVVAHHGFRDEELLVPRAIFEAAGLEVVVASNYPGEAAGSHGAIAKVDIVASRLHPADYAGIVVVGGPGVRVFFHDTDLFRILKGFETERKPIGAICSGPVVLANAGLLSGKKATCYVEDRHQLEMNGAYYTGHMVEREDMVVTAHGPEAAKEFAEAFLQMLHWHGRKQAHLEAYQAQKRRF